MERTTARRARWDRGRCRGPMRGTRPGGAEAPSARPSTGLWVLLLGLIAAGGCGAADPGAELDDASAAGAIASTAAGTEATWRPLFNGRDLDGWTPKIRGSALGVDEHGTFRVEDGLLTVSYEEYGPFEGRFGHLFFEEPFSHYRLRIEYRFVGEQVEGGEGWAFKNSGVMFHAQSPSSMLVGQDFPISLEAQFLGGGGSDPRPTANLCTPGTHVVMDGELVERHCTESSSDTYHGEEWVTTEFLVLGDSLITHSVEGTEVLRYGRPIVGGGVVNGFDPGAKADGSPLTSGYIALQSESHPIQFRRVELLPLDPGA